MAGTISLDLAGSIPAECYSTPVCSAASSAPLTSLQKIIVAHAILCTIGFLLLLPAGVLVARYFRTRTVQWYEGHWSIQFLLAGPVILVGIILGFVTVSKVGAPHFSDIHTQVGLALLLLYFAQCTLGAIIHYVKPKIRIGRPPQNYLHAFAGLFIIGLAFYQVRTGYSTEWPNVTGRGYLPSGVGVVWLIWLILMIVLYTAGLAFLRTQFAQERAKRFPVPTAEAFELPPQRHSFEEQEELLTQYLDS